MPIGRFTGFERTALAVEGCFALSELFERFGPANGNAQRVNSRGEFTATNHELVLLNIRDLTLVITFKKTHSSAPERRSSLQIALPQ
jgi:hypothetical protein